MAKKAATAKAANGKPAKRGAPQKKCPKCGTENHARKAVCVSCGYKFEIKAKKQAKQQTSAVAKRGRPKASANGRADVRAILTVQAMLKTMSASELKGIVDQVADANVPF